MSDEATRSGTNQKGSERVRSCPSKKRKRETMAPTAQQLSAEWMTEAEKETETDKLMRKSKQSPFVPIGELNKFHSVAYILLWFKTIS